MRGRFVGREGDLEALESIVDSSRRPAGPSAAIVTGPPGSGKSRLLLEAAARMSGPADLRVVGYEPESAVSLAAASDLLLELARTPRTGRRVRSIVFGDGSWSDRGTPLGLFEAAHRCVAVRAPTTIWVDDLQWVDSVTGALLSYLVRASAADGVRLAVVAAGRPSPAVGAFRDGLAAIMAPTTPPIEIELEPLPEDAGVAMIRSLAPTTAPEDARRIWQRASGSPFWIEALTSERDAMDAGMARRLRQLGPDGVSLLQALAVIARPSDPIELTALLRWEAPRLEAAVRELSGRGLAVETATSVETSHDLIREAARAQVPEQVARTLHVRLARQLHDGAAGDVRKLREALDHARTAGDDPLGIAVDLVGTAQRRLLGHKGVRDLAAVADAADPGDPRRQTLEEGLAELASELGERSLELERWLAVSEGSTGLARGRALASAAKAAYRMGRREIAGTLIARAREGDNRDLALEIALDALESEVLRWLEHRLPAARHLTTRALARADGALAEAEAPGSSLESRLRAACIEAITAAADLALQEGNERDQARFAERIVGLAEGELERMEASLMLASAYRRSGRTKEAEAIARRVRAEAERRLYPAIVVTAGHHLARALYSQARVEEAEAASAEAERLSARIGETGRFLSEIRNLRPGIAVSRGNWRAGIARLRADIESEPDPHYQLGIQQEIATWLARLAGAAEADEVRAQIAAARRSLESVGCPRCGREMALKTAEALARIGDIDAARRTMAPQIVEQTRHSEEGRLYLRQALGAVMLAAGRRRRAASVLRRLGRQLERAGMAREALWADMDCAAALAADDPSTAISLLRSVAGRARAGGVLTDLEVARQRLGELGARLPPPRRSAGLLGLSRREMEVARLAASGASNPEIATALFLSRKTVERHVSAALAKVGARNRTELASRLTAAEHASGSEMRELPDTDITLAG